MTKGGGAHNKCQILVVGYVAHDGLYSLSNKSQGTGIGHNIDIHAQMQHYVERMADHIAGQAAIAISKFRCVKVNYLLSSRGL